MTDVVRGTWVGSAEEASDAQSTWQAPGQAFALHLPGPYFGIPDFFSPIRTALM